MEKINSMRIFSFALVVVVGLVSGCSTPYMREGLAGGYQDRALGKNRFQISVLVNGFSSTELAEKFFARRAGEITREQGFERYEVIELKSVKGKRKFPEIVGVIKLFPFEKKKKVKEKIATSNPMNKDEFPRKPITLEFVSAPRSSYDIGVVIGNANYKKQGKDIPNVFPAYADAEGVKQWLVRAKGVREGNIISLRDATFAQMVGIFGSDRSHKGQLFNWTKPNVSNVYVYYAGHGAPAGDEGSAYLVPSDSNSATIELTGYPLSTLYQNLKKLPAKTVTLILESCFSGASQNGSVISRTSGILVSPKVPTAPRNITVISAGRANQIASWEQDNSHSLFTKYFLKGKSGEADKSPYGNGDGKVNYGELSKYLEGTVTYYARRNYGRDQNAQIVTGIQ